MEVIFTPQFYKACNDKDIIAICMPPRSSHLIQPLSIGYFGPLKRAYVSLVNLKMRLGFSYIDKLYFLASAAKQQVRQRINERWKKQWASTKGARPSKRLVKHPRKAALRLYKSLPKPYTSFVMHSVRMLEREEHEVS